MPTVVYSVFAALPDKPTLDRYLAWLTNGHVQAVIAGGASSAAVSRLEPLEANRVRVDYRFPDRPTLDRYEQTAAPALRAEGLRLFPPESGVRFERQVAHEHFTSNEGTADQERSR